MSDADTIDTLTHPGLASAAQVRRLAEALTTHMQEEAVDHLRGGPQRRAAQPDGVSRGHRRGGRRGPPDPAGLLMRWVLAAALAGCTAQAAPPLSGGGSPPSSATGNAPTVDSTLAQCQALTPDEGDLCFPTNSPYTMLARSAGVWSYRHGRNVADMTPTTAAGWPTTITVGAAPDEWSVTDHASGGLVITHRDAGTDQRGVFRTLPAAPYTITMAIDPTIRYADYTGVWIMLRETAGGTIKIWSLWEYGSGADGTSRAYNADANWAYVSGGPTTAIIGSINRPPTHYRVRDDNTNRYFEVSYDGGVRFETVFSEGRTVYLTPTQIGISARALNASATTTNTAATATVWSYKEE